MLEVLLILEDEVAGRRGVVVVVVEGVALKVSSSVVCDLSVTVTTVVVRRMSVASTGVSVRELSRLVVVLLTVGGAVVSAKLTLFSLVWDEIPSVPSWF